MKNGKTGKQRVAVLSTAAHEMAEWHRMIESGSYGFEPFRSLAELREGLDAHPCLAAILDVDSVPLDNRQIRDLTAAFPSIHFLCVSRERFHPELKEAICYHLFACLNKPVDPDELLYFLRCIRDNQSETRGPPLPSHKPSVN